MSTVAFCKWTNNWKLQALMTLHTAARNIKHSPHLFLAKFAMVISRSSDMYFDSRNLLERQQTIIPPLQRDNGGNVFPCSRVKIRKRGKIVKREKKVLRKVKDRKIVV